MVSPHCQHAQAEERYQGQQGSGCDQRQPEPGHAAEDATENRRPLMKPRLKPSRIVDITRLSTGGSVRQLVPHCGEDQ